MRFPLFGLVRPIALTLLGLTALAAALGRTIPDEPEVRREARVRYHSVDGHVFGNARLAPRFLDVETGEIFKVSLPASDHLERLCGSPWCDDRGQSQMVGLWQNTSDRSGEHLSGEFGLARCTFPEGRVLDRLALDAIVPTSLPCWYPETALRVLFAAANGRLYRVSFPDEQSAIDPESDDLLHPRPLDWKTTPPTRGAFWLNDPIWPTDPRLKGKILTSVTFSEGNAPEPNTRGSQLWWLQLSQDGTAIEGAGRVTVHGSDGSERWPAFATVPDGTAVLAYLIRSEREPAWRLHVASLLFDSETGAPRIERSVATAQVGSGLPAAPAFSTDGQWVYFVGRRDGSTAQVERVSVPDTLRSNPDSHLVRTDGHAD